MPPADAQASKRSRRNARERRLDNASAAAELASEGPVAQPITRDAAINRLLDDTEGTTELLHQLAERARDEREPAAVKQWRAHQQRLPIEQLYAAYHPEPATTPTVARDPEMQAAHDELERTRRVLDEVLASPEMTAAVLKAVLVLAVTGRIDTRANEPVKAVLDEMLRTLTQRRSLIRSASSKTDNRIRPPDETPQRPTRRRASVSGGPPDYRG